MPPEVGVAFTEEVVERVEEEAAWKRILYCAWRVDFIMAARSELMSGGGAAGADFVERVCECVKR